MAKSRESRQTYLQTRILNDHLEQVALKHSNKTVEDGLTYASAISLLSSEAYPAEGNTSGSAENTCKGELDISAQTFRPGGLSEVDLKRFGSVATPVNSQYEAQVVAEMKHTLLSILDFYSEDSEVSDDEDEKLERAFHLPDQIRAQKDEVARQRSLLREQHTRIRKLVTEINELHPRLEEELVNALVSLPPLLNASRAAQADVLALTIETCLLKLSLIRARAHITLYGHASPSNPRATMTRALAAAQAKLRVRQQGQEEEERALDEQIAAYESLLGLVGGREGAFAQVVEDMARVKKETEECKRDLRRLGWTGD